MSPPTEGNWAVKTAKYSDCQKRVSTKRLAALDTGSHRFVPWAPGKQAASRQAAFAADLRAAFGEPTCRVFGVGSADLVGSARPVPSGRPHRNSVESDFPGLDHCPRAQGRRKLGNPTDAPPMLRLTEAWFALGDPANARASFYARSDPIRIP